MIKEFKAFISKGNIIDLAIAVIMGTAFGAMVASFTNDVLMQLIASIFGQPDFSSLIFHIGNGEIRFGAFINTVINFLLAAFVLFIVVKIYAGLSKPNPAVLSTKDCPYCLSSIPEGASRCPNCTSELNKVA